MSELFTTPPINVDIGHQSEAKYLRIAREIAETIESGRLTPGRALPAQREMAEHFGVTLMTMRQALNLLVDQGLVNVNHGRGTFVAERPHRMLLDGLTSFAEQMAMAGRVLRSELLHAGEMPAPHGVRARMGLEGSSVFCITRRRWIDETPIVFSMSLVPLDIAVDLDVAQLADASLYDTLAERCGLIVDRSVESFRAALMTEEEAAVLHRPAGSPALVNSRLTFDRTGRPIVDDRVVMPGDEIVVSTERRVEHLDVSLRLPGDDTVESEAEPDETG
ncbi:MAG: GntR family transcriptional regulator [Pseudonocardia sp.]|nr:GntR family transcriptional regulator [Pseudonocardia sp.]